MLETLMFEAGPAAALASLAANHGGPGIGKDRALEIVASGLIPFALALAAHTGDVSVADAASRPWEQCQRGLKCRHAPGRPSGCRIDTSRQIGARGAQGLLHLDTTLCQPRRCFECPIAAAELAVTV